VRLDPALRAYGEARGLAPAAWAALAPDCPFETARYADGVLSLEHEGCWVDAEAFVRELASALGPGGEGHLDVIDNAAWTFCRYHLVAGNFEKQQFGIDDVLEHTKNEGQY